MYTIEQGDYECPKCKRFTVIGRTKKSEYPLTCCGIEMVKQGKKRYSEPPAPRKESATVSTTTRKRRSSGSSRSKTTVAAKTQVEEFPLIPGTYRCPCCGRTRELSLQDNRDKPLRCPECFVKMVLS